MGAGRRGTGPYLARLLVAVLLLCAAGLAAEALGPPASAQVVAGEAGTGAAGGDIDTDTDTVPDAHDNCDTVPNPDQADADGNGVGDLCEGPREAEPPPDEAEPPPDEAEPPPDEAEPPPDESEPPPDEAEPPPDEAESAPVAMDDAVDTVQGAAVIISFLTNDADPGGNARARIVAQPANGSAEILERQFRYTPQASFVGSDGFSYLLCRGDLPDLCDSATVAIRVHPAEGRAEVALAEPIWQAISQRGSETLPSQCRGALAWGGFANGLIPPDQMAAVGAGHLLEGRAAAAFVEMRAAAEREGVSIPITDSYRSFEGQVDVRRRKGAFVATATPGTSVHGWGKAIDIDLGNPALQPWLERNATRFGWVNPAWAQRAGKSFEPWHYEFYGVTPGAVDSGCTPLAATLGTAGVQVAAGTGLPGRPGSDAGLVPSQDRLEGGDVGVIPTVVSRSGQGVGAALGLLALAASGFASMFGARVWQGRGRER